MTPSLWVLIAVVAAGHRLLDLPGDQHVAKAGRDGRGEVDRAHLAQRPAGPPQVVEHVQVVEEGLLDVHGQGFHLAAAAGDGHPALLVGQRRGVEELGDALPALGLDEQDGTPVRGQGEGQGGGDGGLAGPALAGDDVQSRGGGVGAHLYQPRSSGPRLR
jgi:hypothetical protein